MTTFPETGPGGDSSSRWAPLLESAARTGADAWVERQLFERLGRWSAVATDPEVAVFLAEQSRRHGWHAEVLVDRLPELSVVDRHTLVAPAGPATEALLVHLGTLDDAADDVRVAVAHRVVLALVIDGHRRRRREVGEVGDAATLRWTEFLLSDDLDAWASAEHLVRRLARTDAQLDAVLDATAAAERLALATDGLSR